MRSQKKKKKQETPACVGVNCIAEMLSSRKFSSCKSSSPWRRPEVALLVFLIKAVPDLVGLRPEQVMVLMEDPEILAQILEPPKASAPQFASSHFVAQQNQTETVLLRTPFADF